MKKFRRLFIAAVLSLFMTLPCYAAEATQTTVQEEAASAAQETETNTNTMDDAAAAVLSVGYIFVGDSRMEGLRLYAGLDSDADIWTLSGTSRGYRYLANSVDRDIAAIKSSNPQVLKWYEVYNLGINDIGNIDKYCSFYQNRAASNNVILVSVTPIEYHKSISDEAIINFNNRLKALNLPYIDSYAYLMQTGYDTWDGTHYTVATSKTVATYLKIAARAYR